MKPEQITAWALNEASAEERQQLEAALLENPQDKQKADETKSFCDFLLTELRDESLALTDKQRERLVSGVEQSSRLPQPVEQSSRLPSASETLALQPAPRPAQTKWRIGIIVRLAVAACIALGGFWTWQSYSAKQQESLAVTHAADKPAVKVQLAPKPDSKKQAGQGPEARLLAETLKKAAMKMEPQPGKPPAPAPVPAAVAASPALALNKDQRVMTPGDVERLKRIQDQNAYALNFGGKKEQPAPVPLPEIQTSKAAPAALMALAAAPAPSDTSFLLLDSGGIMPQGTGAVRLSGGAAKVVSSHKIPISPVGSLLGLVPPASLPGPRPPGSLRFGSGARLDGGPLPPPPSIAVSGLAPGPIEFDGFINLPTATPQSSSPTIASSLLGNWMVVDLAQNPMVTAKSAVTAKSFALVSCLLPRDDLRMSKAADGLPPTPTPSSLTAALGGPEWGTSLALYQPAVVFGNVEFFGALTGPSLRLSAFFDLLRTLDRPSRLTLLNDIVMTGGIGDTSRGFMWRPLGSDMNANSTGVISVAGIVSTLSSTIAPVDLMTAPTVTTFASTSTTGAGAPHTAFGSTKITFTTPVAAASSNHGYFKLNGSTDSRTHADSTRTYNALVSPPVRLATAGASGSLTDLGGSPSATGAYIIAGAPLYVSGAKSGAGTLTLGNTATFKSDATPYGDTTYSGYGTPTVAAGSVVLSTVPGQPSTSTTAGGPTFGGPAPAPVPTTFNVIAGTVLTTSATPPSPAPTTAVTGNWAATGGSGITPYMAAARMVQPDMSIVSGANVSAASASPPGTLITDSQSDTRYFYIDPIPSIVTKDVAPQQEARRPDPSGESYTRIIENELKDVAREPLSTLSIDVDTASYANVRRFLNQNMIPPPDAVRIEELVNYFPTTEEGPAHEAKEPFAVRVELAPCPWQPVHRLARIAIKGREMDKNRKASNLVFLVDVSGSMNQPAKLPLVQQSLRMLTAQLGEGDHVTIVVYAGSSGVVLPPTNGERKSDILAAIDRLSAGGSTHGSAGIKLAYEQAVAGFIKGGVNRVILCTDGDFNVGVSSPEELEKLIKHKAKTGVFLSVLGFGSGNLQDRTMETLADKGNGNYAYIDSLSEARKVLVEQMGSTLETIAKDVKIQVEFNPAAVRSYRLIGYENRLLAKEDFNDDTKDAGEIGAGHSVVALYEIVPANLPPGTEPRPAVDSLKYQAPVISPAQLAEAAKSGEMMTVKLRYKAPDSDLSKLIEVPTKDEGKTLTASTDEFKFSAAVAGFGLLLRDSAYQGTLTWETVRRLALDGKGADKLGYRGEFLQLIDKARGLKETR